jgi:hypothetical protein
MQIRRERTAPRVNENLRTTIQYFYFKERKKYTYCSAFNLYRKKKYFMELQIFYFNFSRSKQLELEF